jgi:hypothetical protein
MDPRNQVNTSENTVLGLPINQATHGIAAIAGN